MNHVKAIGFDLFNTLIFARPNTLAEAMDRLTQNLHQNDLRVDGDAFRQAHREAAMRLIETARKNGRETHNRFWISAALESLGWTIPPEDARIAEAVEAYFSSFYENCRLIPDTPQMLARLGKGYRIGLLSNFTHAPAALKIIDGLGIRAFFDVVLISGDLGFRKPHLSVFQTLIERLGVDKDQLLYVGDDVEPDIRGAKQAGIQPVWTTYVQDNHIPPTPGVLSRSTDEPDFQVPRISSWDDLLALLNHRDVIPVH